MSQRASAPRQTRQAELGLVAWEITRNCNLYCAHCRASAQHGPYEGELSREECFALIEDILEVHSPVLILTGGEPLMRGDFVDIAKYAADKGLRVVRQQAKLSHSPAGWVPAPADHRERTEETCLVCH